MTLYHEIGHCVHSIVSDTKFQHLSGARGTVDFVEFPSHLFEYYIMDPSSLQHLLKAKKSGKNGNGDQDLAMDHQLQIAVQAFRRHRNKFAFLS